MRPWFRVALSTLALGAAGYFLWRQTPDWSRLERVLLSARGGPLAAMTAVTFLSLLLDSYTWSLAYRALARPSAAHGLREAIALLNVSGLLKYIPGKIWSYLAQVDYGRTRGFELSAMVQAHAACSLAVIVSGLALGSVHILVREGAAANALAVAGPVAFGLAVAVAYLAGLPIFNRLLSAILRRDLAVAPPRPSRFLALLALALANWLLMGSAAALGVTSWSLPLDLTDWLLVVTASSAAWLASSFAFIAPGGLGIRESVFFLLLRDRFGAELALAVPLLTRLALLASEVGLGAIGIGLRYRYRQSRS
jgi:hypothetical protein